MVIIRKLLSEIKISFIAILWEKMSRVNRALSKSFYFSKAFKAVFWKAQKCIWSIWRHIFHIIKQTSLLQKNLQRSKVYRINPTLKLISYTFLGLIELAHRVQFFPVLGDAFFLFLIEKQIVKAFPFKWKMRSKKGWVSWFQHFKVLEYRDQNCN